MRAAIQLRIIAISTAVLVLTQAASAQEQRAVLELTVNGVAKGEALVVLRDRDALVGVARLREAGVRGFDGSRETLDGEELVSLASLAGTLTFSVDEQDLRLVLAVSPDRLGGQVRTFRTAAPADMVYRSDTSAFVNYAVNWAEGGGTGLFTESAVRLRRMLLYNTATAASGGVLRGVTSAALDDRRRMRRWVVGDAFVHAGALGGDAWTGGITLTREFGIEPYFVRQPSLAMSAPIAVPSTVEVHVNGRVVSQEQVLPGRLDLRDLPLTVGRNDARVVVRDAFGTSREISTSYYMASSGLAPGLHDYQYSLGFRRGMLGTSSWGYEEPVALARHRVGVNSWFTAGARAEASRDLFSAGPSMNVRLPFGEAEGALGVSGGREGAGTAALVGYTFAGRPVSFGGSWLLASERYTTISARLPGERSAMEANAFGSVSIGNRLSVTAQHSQVSRHDDVRRSRSALLSTVHLTRTAQVILSAARTRDEGGRGREFFAGLSMVLGSKTAGVSIARTPTGTSVGVEAQHPLPVGIGYGYQGRLESGTPGSASGALQYQGRYGRYELRRDVVGGNGVSTASVAGSVVAIGGGLFASRPVQNSFALIRVPGVEGVRGFASNQEVGRTNGAGNLLVPDLQAYYGNILNIADSDIPLQYAVEDVRMTLAVPYRGGALADFRVERVRRVTGSVRVGRDAGERIPVYGELRIAVPTRDAADDLPASPLGTGGEFYFENLPAGRHAATVQDEAGTCAFFVEVPDAVESEIDLGMLRCVPEEAR